MPVSSCGRDEEGTTPIDSKLAARTKKSVKDLPFSVLVALVVPSFVVALVRTHLLPVTGGYIYVSMMKEV